MPRERYAGVIKVKPEKLEEYKQLHSEVWPRVLSLIKQYHVENFSIFYRDGYLFSYSEYVGKDYYADMKQISVEPVMQEWFEVCEPCQEPLITVKGEWWASMEEVFHLD
jgi:L-rhamnose mutarotase